MLYYPYYAVDCDDPRVADAVVHLDGQKMGREFQGFVGDTAIARNSDGLWSLFEESPVLRVAPDGAMRWEAQSFDAMVDEIGMSEEWECVMPRTLKAALKDFDEHGVVPITYNAIGVQLWCEPVIITGLWR